MTATAGFELEALHSSHWLVIDLLQALIRNTHNGRSRDDGQFRASLVEAVDE